jgi:pimeloyl-ACP methyl ester carboxylesterase/heme-degrading monooxygenase HmoA
MVMGKLLLLWGLLITVTTYGQIDGIKPQHLTMDYDTMKIESRIEGLNIALLHKAPVNTSTDDPVLFIHGASFPSALAFGFRMNNYSWMDQLADNGYDVYALDFLGYGNSDRYPEMKEEKSRNLVGSAREVYLDVDRAVEFIRTTTGKNKVNIVAHSWGGSVASLYASTFKDKVGKLVLFASITKREEHGEGEIIHRSYQALTPDQRVDGMRTLTPANKTCPLEKEVFEYWGKRWLQSDPLAKILNSDSVRFPSGPVQDVEDMIHSRSYVDPPAITVPVLVIRGEWDKYPGNADAENLFNALENSPHKKYVVIEKGTHVMHLEQSRYQLYDEVLDFLNYGKDKKFKGEKPIAVIFEVIPAKDRKQNYLDVAASLKPELEKIDGFISIERYESLNNPGKILSLSFWKNEDAVAKWRNMEHHRLAQERGRKEIFSDYRLRVVSVIRDYGMFNRAEAPADSKARHGSEK